MKGGGKHLPAHVRIAQLRDALVSGPKTIMELTVLMGGCSDRLVRLYADQCDGISSGYRTTVPGKRPAREYYITEQAS